MKKMILTAIAAIAFLGTSTATTYTGIPDLVDNNDGSWTLNCYGFSIVECANTYQVGMEVHLTTNAAPGEVFRVMSEQSTPQPPNPSVPRTTFRLERAN